MTQILCLNELIFYVQSYDILFGLTKIYVVAAFISQLPLVH